MGAIVKSSMAGRNPGTSRPYHRSPKTKPNGTQPTGFASEVSVCFRCPSDILPYDLLAWFEGNCGSIKKHQMNSSSNICYIAFTNEAAKQTAIKSSPIELQERKFIIEEITTISPQQEQVVETDSLMVKNLPFSTDEDSVKQILNQFETKPISVSLHFLPNGKFHGTVEANYESVESATKAFGEITGFEVGGRVVRVEYKRQKVQRKENDEYSQFFQQLKTFKRNRSLKEFTFPSDLSSYQRKQIHTIADKLNLFHISRVENEERFIVVSKNPLSESDMTGRHILKNNLAKYKSEKYATTLQLTRQPIGPNTTRGFSPVYQAERQLYLSSLTE